MLRPTILLACVFIAMTTPVSAQEARPQLPGVAEVIAKQIAAKEVPGAITLVTTAEGIVHFNVQGLANIERQEPLKADTIFWIASMTKPITGTMVMLMEQDGKLSLDDAVSKYIPEFQDLATTDGKKQVVTIRHILTHTSGLAEIGGEPARNAKTLADAVALYVKQPLKFEPGSKWVYCQSGINTAARIVEIVSGKTFPEIAQERLFGPLEMRDTTFYLSEDQLPRLVTPYKREPSGDFVAAENFLLMGKTPTSRDRLPAANGGLFSTAEDYGHFCQMILARGKYKGKQILKPETIQRMSSVHSGDVVTGFTPGNGWGVAWCVVREPQGVSAALSPGSFGHGGAYGTQAWIDPVKGRAYILMVQRANFPNSDNSDIRREFQNAAAAALDSK